MATQKEIEKLKKGWCSDPCWDIESTDGFEDHYQELKEYGDNMREQWKNERERKERSAQEKKAKQLGCDGNFALAAYVIALEKRLSDIEEMIYDLQYK
jgi:hypothetical protein